MSCHREHIGNQNEREVRDCWDDTRQQRGNPRLFLRQSSLSVNNKISSYQAAVEFDSNQESSNSGLSETVEVIVEYDPESAMLEEKCIRLVTRRPLHG